MSIWTEWALTSSFLILVVVLLRAEVGKHIGAGLRYGLWGMVLIRLLVPVQLFAVPVREPASGKPAGAQTVQTDVILPAASQGGETAGNRQGRPDGIPAVKPGTGGASGALSGAVSGGAQGGASGDVSGDAQGGASPDLGAVWGLLWLGGAIASGLILLLFNLRFALNIRRRRRALTCDGCPLPVYTLAGLSSPCLFGIFRPALYMDPEAADDPVMLRHVLAHEATHFRHGDHIWSLLRCSALAVHWWNPLVWLAVVLSRRDGELFCDERALKRLGDGERKAYGNTLLALVTARPVPTDLLSCATTMSGGKKALWERIERIARPVKRRMWAAALTAAVALTAAACSFARPVEKPADPPEDTNPGVTAPADPTDPTEPADPGDSDRFDLPFIYNGYIYDGGSTDQNGRPIDKPLDNTKVYEYVYTGTKEGDEAAEEAALAMAEMFMEDLSTPSENRSFRIIEYRNLQVRLNSTLNVAENLDEYNYDTVLKSEIYLLESELGPDKWIVIVDPEFRYEGIMGGVFGPAIKPAYEGENLHGMCSTEKWYSCFESGSSDSVGFLLCRDGDTFTMQSRLHKLEESGWRSGKGKSLVPFDPALEDLLDTFFNLWSKLLYCTPEEMEEYVSELTALCEDGPMEDKILERTHARENYEKARDFINAEITYSTIDPIDYFYVDDTALDSSVIQINVKGRINIYYTWFDSVGDRHDNFWKGYTTDFIMEVKQLEDGGYVIVDSLDDESKLFGTNAEVF